MTKILRLLLCLEKTVIEGARIREKGIAVAVRPRKRETHRCPKCGRRCPAYDRADSPRSWRALALGTVMCWLEAAME
ncbi:MAG: transposase family protein, partial [Eggerthellaceae bacterium]|nr:transposase family protein [Eggerthellaceae bacterium]